MKDNLQSVEHERLHFRTLLLSNANYFGTLAGSKLPVVKALAQNTQYEEIVCVGFQPGLSQLEAVVHVYKSTGYGGSLCSGGSVEYVRFYLSYDNGATWVDQGLTQFNAYNFGHERHLEYAVALPASPPKKFCTKENVIRARAILSWNVPPPANTPNFVPVWGNVRDANIQVAPRRRFTLPELFQDFEIGLPKSLPDLQKIKIPIPMPDPEPWPIEQLHASYARLKIPQSRYLLKHVSDLAKVGDVAPHAFSESLAKLKIDWASILKVLGAGDGNTTYEELTCVGFDPAHEALAGVVHVKLNSGYSGPLCSAGSTEYVAFWVDWGDGAGWTYVGTDKINVHDLSSLPRGGLDYAVYHRVDTTPHRKNCSKGAATARVRAILSWNVAPPTNDPDYTPVWGNREETLIHLLPGAVEEFKPIIDGLGITPVCHIDFATGFANGASLQPFGGLISVTGFIPNAAGFLASHGQRLKYRVRVREMPGSAWQTVGNSFGITVTTVGSQADVVQAADADGFFTYQEDDTHWVFSRLLANWYTTPDMDGLYEIMIEAKDPISGDIFSAQPMSCGGGAAHDTVRVYLDEVAPEVELTVTGFTRGGVFNPGSLPCGTYQVGDVIQGTYTVTDERFGSLSLTVEPAGPSQGHTVNPSSRAFLVDAPTSGANGTWTLDTGAVGGLPAMDPCGYVIRLIGADRTIVNNYHGGWSKLETIGFCLKAPA